VSACREEECWVVERAILLLAVNVGNACLLLAAPAVLWPNFYFWLGTRDIIQYDLQYYSLLNEISNPLLFLYIKAFIFSSFSSKHSRHSPLTATTARVEVLSAASRDQSNSAAQFGHHFASALLARHTQLPPSRDRPFESFELFSSTAKPLKELKSHFSQLRGRPQPSC
jgi:hypothetical protein